MRKRFWLAGAVAVVMLATAVAPAIASTLDSWLIPSQRLGYYGEDCSLTSSIEATVLPGDQVEYQQYSSTKGWEKFGENQSVEETGVLDPAWVRFDESFAYPAKLRAIYRAKASGLATDSISPSVTLNRLKYPASKASISVNRYVNADKSAQVSVRVMPNPGPGKVTVKMYRKAGQRWVYVKTRTVSLNEIGMGSYTITPSYEATYKLVARFAGNTFSVPSATRTAFTTAR